MILFCFECRMPTSAEISGCGEDPAAEATAVWVDAAVQTLTERWEEEYGTLDEVCDLADEWLGKGLWRLECPLDAFAGAVADMTIEPLVPISADDADWLDDRGLLGDFGEPCDDGVKWCSVGQAAPSWFRSDRARLFASFRCFCWGDESLWPTVERAQFRPLRGDERRFWAEHLRRFPRPTGTGRQARGV